MSIATLSLRSRSRVLRGTVAVVVALGYFAALGATSMGHGWQVLTHLALEHGQPILEAPRVIEDVTVGAVVLTTLRAPTHHHGGHAHSHGRDLEDAHGLGAFPASRPEQVETHDLEDIHEHDGTLHSHQEPAEPAVTLTVSLDKHRLPTTLTLAAFSAPRLADLEVGVERLESIDRPVETPPPIRRG